MAYVETAWWLVSWPSCNQSYGLFQARFVDCLGLTFELSSKLSCGLCMSSLWPIMAGVV